MKQDWAVVKFQQGLSWPHEGLEAFLALQSCPELGKESLAFVTVNQPASGFALPWEGVAILGKVIVFSLFF